MVWIRATNFIERLARGMVAWQREQRRHIDHP